MIRNLYKGFNSWKFQESKLFKLRDIELVKSDLLNHIFTKKGERVMMPTFGTIIPEMVFEPLNEDTADIVHNELEYVFDYDPRVQTQSLMVVPDYDNSSIIAVAQLWYVELNLSNVIELNIQFGQ